MAAWLLLCVSICHGQWIRVTDPDILSDEDRLISYNADNNEIWLLGGDTWQENLGSFNVVTNTYTNYGWLYLDFDIYAQGKNYAQDGNILYIGWQNNLYTFDTSDYSSKLQSLTTISAIIINTEYSCLAYHDNHLFITYGWSLYIYNITSNEWSYPSSTPSMNQHRYRHSCEISSDGHLYVIGGRNDATSSSAVSTNTIEKLYIDDIENINNYQWTQLNQTLSIPIDSMETVISSSDFIFTLGGDYYDGNGFQDVVHTINTRIDEVNVIASLYEESCRVSAIITTSNIIYAFYKDYHQIFYANTITQNPTVSHSNQPSISPTNYPSASPSNPPSVYPTKLPTISPTIDPSTVPSNNPTYFPTSSPSEIPSVYPTKQPATSPTNNPSLNPSISPSNTPTTTTPENTFLLSVPTINPLSITSSTTTITETSENLYQLNVNIIVMLLIASCIVCIFVALCMVIFIMFRKLKYSKAKMKIMYAETPKGNIGLNNIQNHQNQGSVQMIDMHPRLIVVNTNSVPPDRIQSVDMVDLGRLSTRDDIADIDDLSIEISNKSLKYVGDCYNNDNEKSKNDDIMNAELPEMPQGKVDRLKTMGGESDQEDDDDPPSMNEGTNSTFEYEAKDEPSSQPTVSSRNERKYKDTLVMDEPSSPNQDDALPDNTPKELNDEIDTSVFIG